MDRDTTWIYLWNFVITYDILTLNKKNIFPFDKKEGAAFLGQSAEDNCFQQLECLDDPFFLRAFWRSLVNAIRWIVASRIFVLGWGSKGGVRWWRRWVEIWIMWKCWVIYARLHIMVFWGCGSIECCPEHILTLRTNSWIWWCCFGILTVVVWYHIGVQLFF